MNDATWGKSYTLRLCMCSLCSIAIVNDAGARLAGCLVREHWTQVMLSDSMNKEIAAD